MNATLVVVHSSQIHRIVFQIKHYDKNPVGILRINLKQTKIIDISTSITPSIHEIARILLEINSTTKILKIPEAQRKIHLQLPIIILWNRQ